MKFLIFYFAGLASLILFIKGFFPVKYSPAKYATYDDMPPPQQEFDENNPHVEGRGYSYEPPVKKLVWIVVDAMRFDFITDERYQDRMPFLKQTLGSGQAKIYKAMAKAPTVTMPRIKALTSGSITGFVDVLLNMNQSPEFKYDNIIYQLREAGGKQMVFYGDNTWLRLFPKTFKRHDGTTSFYVNDYTEVDNNVTRHLDDELERDDWDVMILHYLGLDHIGHLSGPSSLLMNPKLSEMDAVVHQIAKKFLAKENHLVILTSDHGMSGSGSHGGTTQSEITTPLVLIRPPSEERHTTEEPWVESVEQIDIAPSISLAMGVPIPTTSMGKTITGFIENMNATSQLSALQYNCFQLLQHLNSSAPKNVEFASHCYKQALAAHSAFLKGKRGSNGFDVAKSMYKSCQREISDELTSHVSNYNYSVIYLGLLFMFLSASILTAFWFFDLCRAPRFSHTTDPMTSSTLKKFSAALLLGTVMDVGMMGGSSFVEEQHQIWQFLTSTMALALFFGFLQVVYTSSCDDAIKGGSVQASSSLRDVAAESTAKLRKNEAGASSKLWSGRNAAELSRKRSGKLWQQLWLFIAFLALVCHRAMKPWNQTGIKYIDIPDIGDWLNLPQHNSLLSLISIVSLFGCALLSDFILCTKSDKIRSLLTWVGYFFIYNYRHATRSFMLYGSDQDSLLMAAYEARVVYLVIAALLAKSLAFHVSYWFNQKSAAASSQKRVLSVASCYYEIGSRERGCDCALSAVLLLSALLLRPHNHIILALNIFLYVILMRILWPVLVEGKEELLKSYLFKSDYKAAYSDEMSPLQGCARIVLAYWFGQHAFFILGNSNGFATIDLSSAYVGLSSSDGLSNTILSILLGVFATYIGPIVWMTLTLTEMIKTCDSEMTMNRSSKFSTSSIVLSTMAVTRILTVTFYLTVVFGHRYHLFIWSVFAPKLLYEFVSTSVFAVILTLAFVFWR